MMIFFSIFKVAMVYINLLNGAAADAMGV